jgi:hypothetical protein
MIAIGMIIKKMNHTLVGSNKMLPASQSGIRRRFAGRGDVSEGVSVRGSTSVTLKRP